MKVSSHEQNSKLRVLDSVHILNVLNEMILYLEVWVRLGENPFCELSQISRSGENELSTFQHSKYGFVAAESHSNFSQTDFNSRDFTTAFIQFARSYRQNKVELDLPDVNAYSDVALLRAASDLYSLILKKLERTSEQEARSANEREGLSSKKSLLLESINSLRSELECLDNSFCRTEDQYTMKRKTLEDNLSLSRRESAELRKSLKEALGREFIACTGTVEESCVDIELGTKNSQVLKDLIESYAQLSAEEERLTHIREDLKKTLSSLETQKMEKRLLTRFIDSLASNVD